MTRTQIAVVSIVLFLISLAMPALRKVGVADPRPTDPANIEHGILLLALGWTGIFAGFVSWFANPLYLIGMTLYLRRSRKPPRALFTIALFFALSILLRVGVSFQSDTSGGGYSVIVLLAGFWVWTASLAVAALGAWLPEQLKASSGPPR